MTDAATKELEAYDLCPLEDLEEGRVRSVKIRGEKSVCVVRIGDGVRVFNPTCPHHYASLETGVVHNVLEGDVEGRLSIDEGRWIITCPWHRYEYDLQSGQALCDGALRIRLYDIEIVEGMVRTHLKPEPKGTR